MQKYKNKYRIPSARAPWWNYANNGYYFITICTAKRKCLFGNIPKNKNEMILSEIGNIVQQEWKKSFKIRTELFCHAFVIMPNHIHGIVQINNIDCVGTDDSVGTHVETHGRASLRQGHTSPQSQHKLQNHGVAYRPPKSISAFVAGFKSSATKRINEYRNTPKLPVWQSRFHDHIIRNQGEYDRIKQYTETNPVNWENDLFFSETIN